MEAMDWRSGEPVVEAMSSRSGEPSSDRAAAESQGVPGGRRLESVHADGERIEQRAVGEHNSPSEEWMY